MESDSSRCQFVPVWMPSLYHLCLQENGCTALTSAGSFLLHLPSFPQPQTQSPLESVALFLAETHWKWTRPFHPKQQSLNINPHVWSTQGAR